MQSTSTLQSHQPPARQVITKTAAIDGQHSSEFAAHVHEVVGLDTRRATLHAVEARIDSMTVEVEERSALWSLVRSLHEQHTRG
jgi:hypothetical protein